MVATVIGQRRRQVVPDRDLVAADVAARPAGSVAAARLDRLAGASVAVVVRVAPTHARWRKRCRRCAS